MVMVCGISKLFDPQCDKSPILCLLMVLHGLMVNRKNLRLALPAQETSAACGESDHCRLGIVV